MVIIAAALIVLGVYSSSNLRQRAINNMIIVPTPHTTLPKVYTSNFLKISIVVPSNYTIEDNFGSISLTTATDYIMLDRNGTNYDSDNLEKYLDDLSRLNKLQIIQRTELIINGLRSIKAIIKSPISKSPDEMAYFIYNDYAVYSLSASSPSLYSDLDQIAQSFRYNP